MRRLLVRRLGESLIIVGIVTLALAAWIAGADNAIARFVFRLAAISGLLFAAWGTLLRWPRRSRGCLAAAGLAAASLGLLLVLMLASGFEAVWLPWLVLDGGALVLALGLWLRRRRRT